MSLQKRFIPVLVVFVLLFIFIPLRFYAAFDMAYWENWTVYIFEHSIINVYNSDTNYPPFFLYFLYLFGLLQGSVESIKANIALIKYIPLVFDLIPFAVLYFLYKKNYLGGNIHYYLLFNIAYFYNSMVWGQVDGIHSNLCLLSFLAAFQSPAASVILFTLALNTKMQAIIFAPVLAAVLLTQLKGFRHLLQLSAAVLVTELIITLPFILSGNFSNYINVYLTSVDHQPKISLNACNLWYLLFWNADPKEIFDGTPWLILSYKQVGLLLFALSSAFSILPLLLKSVTAFYEKKLPGNYYSLLFLTAGMISISFFYFNTQMHERYIHPAVICLFFYSAWSGNYVLYVLVSIAYLLGMEKVLDFFRLQELFHEPWFMDRRFIAILFSLALADGYRRIWLTYPSGQERQAFRSLISN